MKNVSVVILLSSLFFVVPAMAGSGHSHGHSHAQEKITDKEAIGLATKKVRQLAAIGKIDKTWAGIDAISVEKKKFSHDHEWVITFKNKKVSDQSKQTLYLFYSLGGRYIATNYTGK